MVKIVVGNIYSKILGFLPEEVEKELDANLSYKVKDAKYMPNVKAGSWDGVVHLYYKHKGQSFLTGLMSLVRNNFTKNKIQFEFIDRRIRPASNYLNLRFTPPEDYEVRPYQDLTISRSLQFTRGILEVATGGGKTIMVAKLLSEIKTYPFLFYVLTKDLMEQAHDVFSTYLNVPIGMIGDGKADIQKITVCTVQTAILALEGRNSGFKIDDYSFDDEDSWDEKGIENESKAEKIRTLIGMAKGVVADECHHASSKTCKTVLLASPDAYWRYGASATPKRESGDDIMLQALFGAKIVSINASYLIKNNYLVKPYIFIEPVNVTTKSHTYSKIYKECIVENSLFNKHVADTANHLISRKLSVLVLVKQISHGKVLEKLIPNSRFLTGQVDSKNRTEIIEQLRKGLIPCMVATSLADEGLDIPSLDAVIMAGGGKSSTRLFQRIGRTLRISKGSNKDKSIVILYSQNARYLREHCDRVRRLLKKESEFVVRDSGGEHFIRKEVDDVLGFANDQRTTFDL
jgi:superfamily II DNA or RNA helicase